MDPRSSAVYLRPTPSLSHAHRARRNARRRVLSCRVMKWGARVATRDTGEMCAQSKVSTGQLSAFLRPSALTPCAAQDVHAAASAWRRRRCWSAPLEAGRRTRLKANGTESRKSEHDSRRALSSSTRYMWTERASRECASRKWSTKTPPIASGTSRDVCRHENMVFGMISCPACRDLSDAPMWHASEAVC